MFNMMLQNPTELDRIEVNKLLLAKIDEDKGWSELEAEGDIGTCEIVIKLLLRGVSARGICQSVGIKLIDFYSLLEIENFKNEFARLKKQYTNRDLSLGELLEEGHHSVISKLVHSIQHMEDPSDLVKVATFLSAEKIKHANVKSAIRPDAVIGIDEDDIVELDIGTYKPPEINTVINDSSQITKIGNRNLDTLSFEELENEATIREINRKKAREEVSVDSGEDFALFSEGETTG